MRPPRRSSLPFNDWPAADRELWCLLIAKGDILDGSGPGAAWAPTTKDNTRKAYGYWLGYCAAVGTLNESPFDRLTPARIKAYIEDLDRTVASSTRFAYILDLLRFVKPAGPERDWQWLTDIKNRLWARTKAAKDKVSKIRPSEQLFQLGIELLTTAAAATSRYNPYAAPQQSRDGLMIAMLAARPIRLKNFAAIEIGRHLVRVDNIYWLNFDASEVKNRKPIEVPLPVALTPWIDDYIAIHRPRLLGQNTSKHLWIGHNGVSLSHGVIRYHIKNRTRRTFGEALTPHLFRDCAATSVAIEDPKHVLIAANLLGHQSLATTQKYYDQSHMLEAGRIYQSAMGSLRDDIRKQSHDPDHPRPATKTRER
jgi:integrase/recombinase XerD